MYKKIWQYAEDILSCSAHNMDHIKRVYNLCRIIAETEENVNYDVLYPAVILHDIARVKEDSDNSGKIDHAIEGSLMAEKFLLEQDYDKEIIERIKDCIISHRFRSGNEPNTIEAKILFDADKVDVLGAVGICRCYMYAGQYGQKLIYTKSFEEYAKENIGVNGRLKNPSLHSPNIEYEMKLKKIPERLYTNKAKDLAKERVDFMNNFFIQLKNEIN